MKKFDRRHWVKQGKVAAIHDFLLWYTKTETQQAVGVMKNGKFSVLELYLAEMEAQHGVATPPAPAEEVKG